MVNWIDLCEYCTVLPRMPRVLSTKHASFSVDRLSSHRVAARTSVLRVENSSLKFPKVFCIQIHQFNGLDLAQTEGKLVKGAQYYPKVRWHCGFNVEPTVQHPTATHIPRVALWTPLRMTLTSENASSTVVDLSRERHEHRRRATGRPAPPPPRTAPLSPAARCGDSQTRHLPVSMPDVAPLDRMRPRCEGVGCSSGGLDA